MNKGLEELERLAYENACCRCQYWSEKGCSLHYQDNYRSCVWLCIERELKAFETIDKKSVIVELVRKTDNVEDYNFASRDDNYAIALTREEYDLLKEALL